MGGSQNVFSASDLVLAGLRQSLAIT